MSSAEKFLHHVKPTLRRYLKRSGSAINANNIPYCFISEVANSFYYFILCSTVHCTTENFWIIKTFNRNSIFEVHCKALFLLSRSWWLEPQHRCHIINNGEYSIQNNCHFWTNVRLRQPRIRASRASSAQK